MHTGHCKQLAKDHTMMLLQQIQLSQSTHRKRVFNNVPSQCQHGYPVELGQPLLVVWLWALVLHQDHLHPVIEIKNYIQCIL